MFNKYLVIEQLFIYSSSFQFFALGFFFLMAQPIIRSHLVKNIAIIFPGFEFLLRNSQSLVWVFDVLLEDVWFSVIFVY